MSTLTSDCKPGILKYNLDNGTRVTLPEANYSAYYYHDLYYQGAFCPKEEGMYRIIFDGTWYAPYESERSHYSFNSIQHDSRTSPYHYLRPKTCYPYYTKQAIDATYNVTGALYFQLANNTRILMTSEYSYSCQKLVCFHGSKDPQCFKSYTKASRYPYFRLSYYITFLLVIDK